ncbi:MAG: hypothetical protein OSA99_13465 [Acidimicrobiales bacterium]|nr:hypothetical protein [Acidimicrobiales bacterium]
MLILLALPAIAAVAALHRYLQFYAPTNLLVRRMRARQPRWRSAAVLASTAVCLLVVMHVVADAVAHGAPGWLNVIVLILVWDAIKVSCLAIGVALRAVGSAVATVARSRFTRPHQVQL